MSSPSYKLINYAIRPAKNIERKMIAETLRRVSPFGSLEAYVYIGFGSPFFSDFSLFHRSLGIRNAISIEREEEDHERFEFNVPFKCIQLKFGHSNAVLPNLDWSARAIAWLDYDDPLKGEMLTDVRFFVGSAVPGSVLLVTVNATPDKYNPDEPDERVRRLQDRVGPDKVPHDLGNDLGGWGTAKAYRRIIINEINDALAARNGVLLPGNRIQFRQIFFFTYADGAKMVTLGGLLLDEGQEGLFGACDFAGLPFTRTGAEPYLIDPPKLTLREIRHLDKQLPYHDVADVGAPGLNPEDVLRYAEIYRYFPAFIEGEI